MRYMLFLLPFIFACSGSQKSDLSLSESAVVFSNVNIVDVRNGEIMENRHVVTDSGKIVQIEEEASQWPDEEEVIDATGMCLTPGLGEMHAHIPSPPVPGDQSLDLLVLYTVNGVTTIRGMLGHPAHLNLRDKEIRDEIISSRIYTSSTSFNGHSVETEEEDSHYVVESEESG